MLTIEVIRYQLEDRNLKEVSRNAGLTYSQVYHIVSGRTDPPYSVVKRLSDYLEGRANVIAQ